MPARGHSITRENIPIGPPGQAPCARPILRYTLNPSLAANTPLLAAQLEKRVGVFGAASLFLPSGEQAERGY